MTDSDLQFIGIEGATNHILDSDEKVAELKTRLEIGPRVVISGTGHRPPKLNLGYDDADRDLLNRFVLQELKKAMLAYDVAKVISGGAQGYDQSLALSAIALNIPLVVAIPFKSQHARWPAYAQKRYLDILDQAEVVDIGGGEYANFKFILRDYWMVDNSDLLLALFDEQEKSSGTGATVKYARKTGKPVVNIWESWIAYKKACK